MVHKVRRFIVHAYAVGLALVPTALVRAQFEGFGGQGNVPLPAQPTGIPNKFTDLQTTIATVFNVVIAAAGAIFVILLLVGGIQYLTAAGNEEAVGNARKLLINSIVGLIIVLAAWALGNWILGRVGLGTTVVG